MYKKETYAGFVSIGHMFTLCLSKSFLPSKLALLPRHVFVSPQESRPEDVSSCFGISVQTVVGIYDKDQV